MRATIEPHRFEGSGSGTEIYPAVVDGLVNDGGVPPRLMKTDVGVWHPTGYPTSHLALPVQVQRFASASSTFHFAVADRFNSVTSHSIAASTMA